MTTDKRAAAHAYLHDFAAKDLAALDRRFAPSVTLRDWDLGLVQGKAAVLAANEKIFSAVQTLAIEPRGTYVDGDTAVVELELTIDGSTKLLVTDVITFDGEGRIASIRAYRGN